MQQTLLPEASDKYQIPVIAVAAFRTFCYPIILFVVTRTDCSELQSHCIEMVKPRNLLTKTVKRYSPQKVAESFFSAAGVHYLLSFALTNARRRR